MVITNLFYRGVALKKHVMLPILSLVTANFSLVISCQNNAAMARKSSLFQSSERFLALEEVLRWLQEVLKWLEEVLKWQEEVLNLPPDF